MQTSRRPSTIAWFFLFLILATAAVLRMHHLGEKSLWIDEASSVALARFAWRDFWRELWSFEGNMALYYLLLRGWIRFGDSELVLRSLSVLFGVAAIAAVYAFGKRFLSSEAGLAGAAFLAVHSFHIRYSQEARSYALLLFLVVLSSYLFLSALESPTKKRYWAAYTLISALAVYAHLYAALVLAAQWLSLGPAAFRRIGRKAVASISIALAVLISPLVAFAALQYKGQIEWVPRPTARLFLNVIYELTGNSLPSLSATASPASNMLLALYAALWAFAMYRLIAVHSRPASPKEEFTVRLLASWLVFPIALTFTLSLVKPLFFDRFLLICVPAVVLLAGYGTTTLGTISPRLRWLAALVLTVLVALSSAETRHYFSSFASYGNDWRSATRYVLAQQRPQDAAIFFRTGSQPFEYYARREMARHAVLCLPHFLFPTDETDLAAHHWITTTSREQIGLATKEYDRVWLILHHENDGEPVPIRSWMPDRFRLLSERQFSGAESAAITVVLYGRARDPD